MDLPKVNHYAVRCAICEKDFWTNQQKAELMCSIAFRDKGIEFLEGPLGIIIGFGFENYPHDCMIIRDQNDEADMIKKLKKGII